MPVVGYFTAEIGLWSELHTYSGGLGVLAGDHVKSAADAGIPLVGVTLLYHQGYARQHIDAAGIQTETFPEVDMNRLLSKTDIVLELELDGKPLFAYVWMAEILGQSGHMVPVYFMDTRHPENTTQHQELSSRLYGGDDGVRIRQEYVLGVGGVQLFDHLEVELSGLHLNEGHCTFAMLELLKRGWSREQLAQRSLFTTHTPVPAGHDRFDWSLVEDVIGDLLPTDAKELVRNAGDPEHGARCSMSHLAVSLSTTVNAVSKLNADVAMTMFDQNIQPITNGVHHITWTSPVMASFFSLMTASTSARRTSSSGRISPPHITPLARARMTSGAPFAARSFAPSGKRTRRLIILRVESKGNVCNVSTGSARSPSRVMPTFAPATTSAPSVGLP